MRTAITALLLVFGQQAGAACGKLYIKTWWETATKDYLGAELGAGADT